MDKKYLFRRTAQAIISFVAVVNLSFFLVRFLPGGPMDYLLAQAASIDVGAGSGQVEKQVQVAKVYLNLNPEKPLIDQYISYMSSLLFQGDFGRSVYYDQTVGKALADALPWTMFVMGISLICIFSIGIFLGAIMAFLEGSRFDVATTLYSVIMGSIPFYIVGILFIIVFSHQLGWFPTGGQIGMSVEPGLNIPFITNVLYHAFGPIVSTVLSGIGGVALGMRGNSIRILGKEYLRNADVRGLSTGRISSQYVVRNAVLPMYTSFAISLGTFFGGSVVLERVFIYPGIGFRMFRALEARDYPLLMGGFIMLTAVVIISIFVADLTYGIIDPRAEAGGETREVY